jgi:hypothetical protein
VLLVLRAGFGLEFVAVVVPAPAKAKDSPTVHFVASLNILTVLAECKARCWVVWVWCNFPVVAVRLCAFGWLDIISLNDNRLAVCADGDNRDGVSVYPVTDMCAVSDYWLGSCLSFHFCSFRFVGNTILALSSTPVKLYGTFSYLFLYFFPRCH